MGLKKWFKRQPNWKKGIIFTIIISITIATPSLYQFYKDVTLEPRIEGYLFVEMFNETGYFCETKSKFLSRIIEPVKYDIEIQNVVTPRRSIFTIEELNRQNRALFTYSFQNRGNNKEDEIHARISFEDYPSVKILNYDFDSENIEFIRGGLDSNFIEVEIKDLPPLPTQWSSFSIIVSDKATNIKPKYSAWSSSLSQNIDSFLIQNTHEYVETCPEKGSPVPPTDVPVYTESGGLNLPKSDRGIISISNK